MRKNFTLLFLIGIFGLFTTNLFAQEDATIDPANVRYWIGEGQNEVVFIVNWNNPDTALAWGYRFAAESVTIKDIMDAIVEADYRFDYDATDSGMGYWLNDLFFDDGVISLSLTQVGYASYLVSGESSWDTFDVKTVVNGDYVKWGDTFCGTLVDPENWIYVWEEEVVAVYPVAYESVINPSQIVYWIGEGENEAVFAVNFADPQDECFAWGYRFATENVTIKEMMLAIAEVDHRFAFEDEPSAWGGYMLTDLTFNLDETHYELNGYNAMYNLNGFQSWFTFDEQTVVNGDFVKWGDYTVGTEIAPWTYVWETPVQAVPVYNTVSENVNGNISLYPNPASSYTMLNVNNMDEAVVTVTDLQGRVLSTFTAQGNEPVRIETAGFKAGIYFVTVSDANSRQTMKLSVK
ncbi:MAG: T9SS type A sorting domain-containing protein [Bacteroidales bacterium]|nr:T9SS type A sorting domain-containing protein [Bacteroidales bacterium]